MKKEIHILSTVEIPEVDQKRINELSDKISLSIAQVSHAGEIPDFRWKDVNVLYTWDILPEPDVAPNLDWIQFKRAGVDDFIGHPLAQKQDLAATTMSGVINSQIAEYVLMAMLAFGQKLPKMMQYQADKIWPPEHVKWQEFTPIELRGSTVGILGYGSIGRQVARLLQPFDATILAAKKDVMQPEDTGYVPDGMGDPHGEYFTRLYPIEALHSFLAGCDFVVVTLPLTEETRSLLDANAFEAMKETAFLVNVGRGEIIDQNALVEALKNGQIAGAALDVFEEEPLPKDDPLWEMKNVILSPHVSGLSEELNEDTLALFIENLNRFLHDLPLYNQIDINKGY